MGRRFRYFLFENYDPEQVQPGQEQPRALWARGSTSSSPGRRSPACIGLLDRFGYCRDGALCVPVFRREDQAAVHAVAALVEQVLYEEIGRVLSAARHELNITAAAHHVPAGEVANELYHLLFGSVNEALVSQGLVAAPPSRAGEGRYLRSVQLF